MKGLIPATYFWEKTLSTQCAPRYTTYRVLRGYIQWPTLLVCFLLGGAILVAPSTASAQTRLDTKLSLSKNKVKAGDKFRATIQFENKSSEDARGLVSCLRVADRLKPTSFPKDAKYESQRGRLCLRVGDFSQGSDKWRITLKVDKNAGGSRINIHASADASNATRVRDHDSIKIKDRN